MGENPSGEAASTASNVRMVPLTGRAAQTALERAQEIWPAMRNNRIRVVTPSAVIPTMRPGSSRAAPGEAGGEGEVPPELLESLFGRAPLTEGPAAGPGPAVRTPADNPAPRPAAKRSPSPPGDSAPAAPPASKKASAPADKSAGLGLPGKTAGARIFLAAAAPADPVQPAGEPAVPEAGPSGAEPGSNAAAEDDAEVQSGAEPAAEPPAEPPTPADAEKPAKTEGPPAEIVVAPGPGGIMIASADTEALDAFEELLNSLAGSAFAGNMDVTIFYLKHTKAQVVAETLDQIFGGGTTAGGAEAGGGGLLGDLAGAALGDAGGGLLGSLLGLGGPAGSVAPTGSIQITPDLRLNALVVQANPADTEMVEQLLEILDQKESPEEVMVTPKPRVIPVINAQADEIAEIVKQVYQDRLISGGAGGRQPTPQEFIRMLRGSRRGGRGGAGGDASDVQQKMAIGVDSRNNALIVVAPDKLFQEVKQLVEQVDEAAGESRQTMRVVTLDRANPDAVQQALSALVGAGVQFGRTSTAAKTSRASGSRSRGTGSTQRRSSSTPPRIPAALQQQLRNRLQRSRSTSRSRR